MFDPVEAFKAMPSWWKRWGGICLTKTTVNVVHFPRYFLTAMEIGATMDQITIKTPNPKCRLYWCLIGFTDWSHSQSWWYFWPIFWTSAPLTFSLVRPPPPVWLSTVQGYVFIQCVTGGGDQVVWRAYTGVTLYNVYMARFRTYKIALPPHVASDR